MPITIKSVKTEDIINYMDNYITEPHCDEYDFMISKSHIAVGVDYKNILGYFIKYIFADNGHLEQAVLYHLVILSNKIGLTTNNIYGALIGMSSLIFNWMIDPAKNICDVVHAIVYSKRTIFRYTMTDRTAKLFCSRAAISVYIAMNTNVPDSRFLKFIRKHNTSTFHDNHYDYIRAMIKAALIIVSTS